MELKEQYESKSDIEKWFHLLDRQWGDAITDKMGLHMAKWVTDNPIPHKSANYADFLNWIDSFDNEEEMAKTNLGI